MSITTTTTIATATTAPSSANIDVTKLPSLPKPARPGGFSRDPSYYSARQMRDYALTCIADVLQSSAVQSTESQKPQGDSSQTPESSAVTAHSTVGEASAVMQARLEPMTCWNDLGRELIDTHKIARFEYLNHGRISADTGKRFQYVQAKADAIIVLKNVQEESLKQDF